MDPKSKCRFYDLLELAELRKAVVLVVYSLRQLEDTDKVRKGKQHTGQSRRDKARFWLPSPTVCMDDTYVPSNSGRDVLSIVNQGSSSESWCPGFL